MFPMAGVGGRAAASSMLTAACVLALGARVLTVTAAVSAGMVGATAATAEGTGGRLLGP